MFNSFLFFPTFNIFICRTRILLKKFLSVACVGGRARLLSIKKKKNLDNDESLGDWN